VTTSSTWSSESGWPLRGCGVDLERIARFERLARPDDERWPLVFSARELDHARTLGDPARGLCAAFCCKEALFKALGAMFEYPECELLYDPATERQTPLLAAALAARHGIADCAAWVKPWGEGECLGVVYLFGQAP
jgi:phosphopantetheinyl transferase (holo-ACP synthase)